MKHFSHVSPCESIPTLNRIHRDGKRFYENEGVYYPSVTTVLSVYPPTVNFLTGWRAKVGDEKAEQISYVARERGTRFHDLCEKYLNNDLQIHENSFQRYNINPDVVEMFKCFQSCLDRIDNISGLELQLFSKKLKTAGTVDCIGEFDGIRSVIDFKTSKYIKDEERIQQYFMQATAYSFMWEELTGEIINNIVVLIANRINEYVNLTYEITHSYSEFVRNRNDYVKPLIEVRKLFKEINEPE
jgi:genome maintenance exonuclease 1